MTAVEPVAQPVSVAKTVTASPTLASGSSVRLLNSVEMGIASVPAHLSAVRSMPFVLMANALTTHAINFPVTQMKHARMGYASVPAMSATMVKSVLRANVKQTHATASFVHLISHVRLAPAGPLSASVTGTR